MNDDKLDVLLEHLLEHPTKPERLLSDAGVHGLRLATTALATAVVGGYSNRAIKCRASDTRT